MKFHYNDKVRIISGFYKGSKGVIIDTRRRYRVFKVLYQYEVRLKDIGYLVIVNEEDLELIK